MGCAQTRNSVPEDELQAYEEKLGFTRFDIPKIKQVFFSRFFGFIFSGILSYEWIKQCQAISNV